MLPYNSAIYLHAKRKNGDCFARDEILSYEVVTEENVLELKVPTGYQGTSVRSWIEGHLSHIKQRDSDSF